MYVYVSAAAALPLSCGSRTRPAFWLRESDNIIIPSILKETGKGELRRPSASLVTRKGNASETDFSYLIAIHNTTLAARKQSQAYSRCP